MSEYEKYLELSETALDDFEKGIEAGQSVRALYNRLYYACFYSAKAALLSRGIDARSHAGVADRVFTVLYREEELVSKEVAAVLNRVQSKRDVSDYELEIASIEDEIDVIESEARDFIDCMGEIVRDK